MTILEMKDKRALLLAECRTKLSAAKKETRKLSEAEQAGFDSAVSEVEDLDKKILAAEEELRTEEGKKKVEPVKNVKMKKEFNLLTAIRNRAEGRAQDEASIAVLEAGRTEMRHAGISPEGDIVLPTEYRADILAGTATQGQEVVAEDKMGILGPLREALVMVQAGATYMTGLVGDVSIPVYAGTTAAWKGEVAAADDGGGAFSEIALAPMRLTTYIDVSKQFLNQDSASAEAMLKQDIVLAIAGKLEGTILGTTAASAGVNPAGFFASGYTATIAGSVSWGDIVDLEAGVDGGNALVGNLKYITNAAGRGILKQKAKDTGSGLFVMDSAGSMNGYQTLVSNHVPATLVTSTENGIIFGNFADYVIAQWGGIDLIVDPYSQATTGQVRLVINSYWDAKPRRAASFKVGSLKV